MRAYDLSMVLIFFNCSFPILDAMGITTLSNFTSSFWLLNIWSAPLFTVAGFTVNSVTALAGVFALGTVVVLNSNMITDRGMAVTVFATVFWGSFLIASVSLSGIIMEYPMLAIFYTIFFLGSTFIFINSLVQFPTGGQGAHI
jgi:hypothetical protein